MKIWIDAQLSPAIADWIRSEFGFDAVAIREIGLRDAEDLEIFISAKAENAIRDDKGSRFRFVDRPFWPATADHWLTCGNTSNRKLKKILSQTLTEAVSLLNSGETIVEINAPF